jgi:hypothetical protein
VFLAALPERRVVVVHVYLWRGDEEERVAACVGGLEGGGLVEVGIAHGNGCVAEVCEFVVGGVGGGLYAVLEGEKRGARGTYADDEVLGVHELVVEDGVEDGGAEFAGCAGES